MNGLIVDNFAGGGGASTGIEWAMGRPIDIAINHDPKAIAMHKANHPDTRHYCEDVWTVDPRAVTNGQPVALAWFSPDCTHHSKAKGGRPREKNIRALAWVVLKWAALTRPAVIMLENVEEFANWGPLTRSGRICKRRKGMTFEKWVGQLRDLGYAVEWKERRACDFGVPTIRKRLVLIARCDGRPIVWPDATHGPQESSLLPYRTAASDVIDWSIPCPSIFERKRPLADATCRRIARGVVRYVLDTATPFIVGVGGRMGQSRERSVLEPLQTLTAKADSAVVVPHLSRMFGNSVGHGLDEPMATVMPGGGGKTALVAAFLAQHNGGPRNETISGRPVDQPVSTIATSGSQQQLVSAFLSNMYSSNTRGGGGDPRDPLTTVTTSGNHHALVHAFLMKYYGTGGQWQDCRDPLHTITAKARFGLVTVEIGGEPYVITDIGMRMLNARELFRAQGFPEGYEIQPLFEGKFLTETDAKRMCGDSVCPEFAAVHVRANLVDAFDGVGEMDTGRAA